MQPDIQNVEVPDWIAGGSALLLLVALFLPWVKVSWKGIGRVGTTGASFGWVSIIAVLAVFAMFLVTLFDVELPFPSGLVYLGSGALSLLFTLLVIVFRPIGTGVIGFSGISKIPWYGAFIGLIAGIGILVGGLMKFKEQRY